MADIHYASSSRKPFSSLSAYRLAGRTFSADIDFPELVAFHSDRAPFSPARSSPKRLTRPARPNLIFQGPGRIGNVVGEVQCIRNTNGFQLEVDRAGTVGINSQGTEIVLHERAPNGSPDVLSEVVLGPALILALALQGTWCLHASAVASSGQVVCFLGRSGSGKSTLAAFLDEFDRSYCRLADDILPVRPGRDGLDTLPRYPQLKLPPDAQPSLGVAAERVPLAAIYVIAGTDRVETKPEVRSLAAQDATLALVRLTVAARIFDNHLLARHLAFCANVAGQIPVRELAYPRSYDMLPKVGRLLAADLLSMNGDRIPDG